MAVTDHKALHPDDFYGKENTSETPFKNPNIRTSLYGKHILKNLFLPTGFKTNTCVCVCV